MKVYESIDIEAPPLDVWAHIADPHLMARWHAKLVDVRREHRGPPRVGERFGTSYIMNESQPRQRDCETEVLRSEPWATLVLRHHALWQDRPIYVDETYHLLPRLEDSATGVEHSVDFAGAQFPAWMRALMWCITRTGKPQGEGILEPLKRACESEPHPAIGLENAAGFRTS